MLCSSERGVWGNICLWLYMFEKSGEGMAMVLCTHIRRYSGCGDSAVKGTWGVCVCVLVCGLNEAFILQESFKILSKWVRSAASANALSPNSASWASLHSPRHPHFKQTTRFRPDQHCRLEQQTWCKIMVNQKYEARFSNITNNRPPTQDDIWAWSCCHRSHLMGRSDGRADTHDATLPCSNFNPCSFPVPHNNISYVLLTSSHLTHPLTIQMRLSNH